MCLGIPGQVVEIVEGYAGQLALVDVEGAKRRVNIGMLDSPPDPGAWVLIHLGFAVELIDAQEAARAMSGLELVGQARRLRRRYTVSGLVQGVGFRPFAYACASSLALSGSVANTADGVVVEVEGEADAVHSYGQRLRTDAPPLAMVIGVRSEDLPLQGGTGFTISSSHGGPARTLASPDVAICADCLRELRDPADRRYRHPFITCTNCGPRFTIIKSLPYDRAATTMAGFAMCAACRTEYDDPADRRFHAEASACHVCGPKARLVRFDARPFSFDQFSMMDDVDAACGLMKSGEIVAIKGIGGYQLACDATKADVVAKLRRTKHRDAKPFALMARDLDVIRRYCSVSLEEAALLTAPSGPIVVLHADGIERLPDAVAPGPCSHRVCPPSASCEDSGYRWPTTTRQPTRRRRRGAESQPAAFP